MTAAAPADGTSFTGIGDHLSNIDSRIGAMARRTRRFSWFCWSFLFGAYGAIALAAVISVLFPVVTTTVTSYGVSTSSTGPWWAIPVSVIPAVVLLTLAVREAVLGRREADSDGSARPGASGPSPEVRSAGWTETVQRCQQRVTHARSEVEWSFVPLVLGWFALVEACVTFVEPYLSLSAPDLMLAIIIVPVVALASIVVLWPLYRLAKGWVRRYQLLLDRQVGELSKLEAEFLWRFAGADLPA